MFEIRSKRVNSSPKSLEDRIELKTSIKDETELTVIISVIARVPKIFKYLNDYQLELDLQRVNIRVQLYI